MPISFGLSGNNGRDIPNQPKVPLIWLSGLVLAILLNVGYRTTEIVRNWVDVVIISCVESIHSLLEWVGE